MGHTLMYTACADNVNVGTNVLVDIVLGQAPTDLDQERFSVRRTTPPFFFQVRGGRLDTIRGEVIQHDNIRAGSNRLICLVEALALNLNLDGKPSRRFCCAHSVGDAPGGHDVVVFQHGHRREVKTVCIDAADQHAILLHKPEARGGLASASKNTRVSSFAKKQEQTIRLGSHARTARQRVEGYALTEE